MSRPDEVPPSSRAGSRPALARLRFRPRLGPALAVVVGLSLAAGLAFPGVWGDAGRPVPTHATVAAAQESAPPHVDVVRPARGGVRRLTMQPGSVHAYESVDLYAKASGFLKSQKVDIGSPIKQGETLAQIEAPELLQDVQETSAAVEQAVSQAEQAASRVVTAEAEKEAADAEVGQAESDNERLASRRVLAEKQYERIRGLHARNAIDMKLVDEHQQEMESARAAERTGHAAVKTARAHAAAAAAKVVQAKCDVTEARAAVRVAEARRERAKVLAQYTRITAPFDGVVTRRTFHPGAFIRSAAYGTPEPLLTVMRTDRMRVVIQVPDLDVHLLDVGDRATVAVDALKGREFAGKVSRLGKSEDPTTRTMRAEVDLDNPDGLLVEGMFGRATIELNAPTDRLTVPAACVVGHADRGKAAVFVVREGKARRIPVTLGNDDGASVEVLTGLGPDDAVIVRPAANLDDGTPVTPPKDAGPVRTALK
ncbi:MAG: efflux RND transporter periplasmic adaptor subunit [Isosphaeraceae bacterium]